MVNIYAGLDDTSTFPGYQLGGRHIDSLETVDIPSAIQPPQILSSVNQISDTRLLRLFTTKGKLLKKSSSIGNVTCRWFEPNAYPRSYKSQVGTDVSAYTAGETSWYFTENAGLEPHVILYNPDTGEEVFISGPQNVGTLSTSLPSKTQLLDSDSWGWEVTRGYGNTTAAAFTVGDRWIRTYKAASEGGRSAWGTHIDLVQRNGTLTDMRFSAKYSEHLHKISTYPGTRSVKERLTVEDHDVMMSIESALWYMNATSSTAGGRQEIASIVTPSSTALTESFRGGDGVIAQLNSGAHTESFSGKFDGNQFDEVVETAGTFKPDPKFTLFCGKHAMRGINSWAEGKADRMRTSPKASEFYQSQNIKTWITATGKSIPIVHVPLFDQHPRTASMAVLLNTKNTEFVYLDGMKYSGKLKAGEQENDESATKYGTGMLSLGVCVKDLLSHAVLTNIYP